MYTLGVFRSVLSKFSSTPFDPNLMEKSRCIVSKFSSILLYLFDLMKLLEKSRFMSSKFRTLFGLKLTERSPEELPLDVLWQIFATLEVPDLVRAGSVCSSWRAAYTSLCNSGSCKPQQTPCLLYTSDQSAGASAACLYRLAEKKAYTLTLPDPPLRSRNIIGSSYGWIVTADERSELHIVNPITGDQIALPSVTTMKQVEPIFDDTGAVCRYEYWSYSGDPRLSEPEEPSVVHLSELRTCLFYKAFLSSDPSTGDYFVVLIHHPYAQLSFARAGDDKWTWLPTISDWYDDCLFNGQLLYACTKVGEIHEFDLGAPTVTHKILLDEVKEIYDETIYIVQSSCGELLQIWRSDNKQHGDEEDEYDPYFEPELEPESLNITSIVKVHKVEPKSKNVVGISNLGANVLFLGHNQSLCLDAEKYPQLKANHVYFTDDWPYNEVYKNRRRDIGVFDLKCNSSEEIVSPQLWSNWPVPVWLVPNPRRAGLSLCK